MGGPRDASTRRTQYCHCDRRATDWPWYLATSPSWSWSCLGRCVASSVPGGAAVLHRRHRPPVPTGSRLLLKMVVGGGTSPSVSKALGLHPNLCPDTKADSHLAGDPGLDKVSRLTKPSAGRSPPGCRSFRGSGMGSLKACAVNSVCFGRILAASTQMISELDVATFYGPGSHVADCEESEVPHRPRSDDCRIITLPCGAEYRCGHAGRLAVNALTGRRHVPGLGWVGPFRPSTCVLDWRQQEYWSRDE